MNALVPKSQWERGLRGWSITDCAVRNSTTVYLVARENVSDEDSLELWDHDITTRFIALFLGDEPDGQVLAMQGFDGFNHPRCGITAKPLSQGIIVSRNRGGDAWAAGSGRSGPMEQIDPGKGPLTMKLKCINGYAYSVGSGRAIYKREDMGRWIKLDNGFQNVEPDLDDLLADGFDDMDGFSESDMYAVGGKGDIWHYDGTIWTQEGFPSNMQLDTVTCAGDGYVYVSGQGGTLWRGRHSTWEKLYNGNYTIPWNDVLWFEDKLWLASDYMLCIWNGKELVSATDNKGQELFISGHMDAYDGLLIVASTERVMAYQNGTWRTLVAPYA